MYAKLLAAGLLIGLFSLPVFAQDNDPHTVTFDGVSFNYDAAIAQNVNIWHYSGDPVEGAGAGFSDAANTIINLYDAAPAPESPLDAKAGIRVYATSDLAQYDFMQAQVETLQALIDGKADLSAFETHNGGNELPLPYLPAVLHAQVLRTHTNLIQTDAIKGISYLTISTIMDAIAPFDSQTFIYVFQGISADGKTYVSASFPVTTTLYPETPTEDVTAISANWSNYLLDNAKSLDTAKSGDFSPSLDTIDRLIQSITFQPS